MATVVGDVASWMFGVLPFPGSRMPLRVDGLLFMVHIYTKREKNSQLKRLRVSHPLMIGLIWNGEQR